MQKTEQATTCSLGMISFRTIEVRRKFSKGPFGQSEMGSIIDIFRSTAFDPETVKALCDAYDKARKLLHDAGEPEIVNAVIAERMVALAKRGERRSDRLAAGALAAVGREAG